VSRSSTEPRKRLRELGVRIGVHATGPHNAITDVAGVRVGHATIVRDEGGTARTGVTAILPRGGNVFLERVPAGAFVLNGAGEVSGLTQIVEWGLIETPILLTNTMSVGRVSDATMRYMLEQFPGIGAEHDVIIPVVGECDDSWLHDVSLGSPTEEDVRRALDEASDGPVKEGSVGAGTGMITCDFAGGIGTSSRRVPRGSSVYTVGVLVLSNFGHMADLRVDGSPVGSIVKPLFDGEGRRRRSYGSIIVVVATDAPILSAQLVRVAKRAALGVGRVGSYAAHGSGEIVVAFSTANPIPRETPSMLADLHVLLDAALDPLYQATVEATEEAILNALCMSEGQIGLEGRRAPALPLDEVARIVSLYRDAGVRAVDGELSTRGSDGA
jgi:D-aminopeptidase